MKVTKFVHSCLLVETPNLKVLIDPGNYSWQSHMLVVNRLPKLDYLVVTHEHADHYSLPAIQAIRKKFPHLPIVTNRDLAQKLTKAGINGQIVTGSEEGLQVFEIAHDPLPLKTSVPLNIGIHIDDLLTHPGDTVHIKHTRDILALPVAAPSWTNLRESLDIVVKIKPNKVIPLHDWHWHKAAREEQYSRAKTLLEPFKIEFIELENGVSVEI